MLMTTGNLRDPFVPKYKYLKLRQRRLPGMGGGQEVTTTEGLVDVKLLDTSHALQQ